MLFQHPSLNTLNYNNQSPKLLFFLTNKSQKTSEFFFFFVVILTKWILETKIHLNKRVFHSPDKEQADGQPNVYTLNESCKKCYENLRSTKTHRLC